MARPCVAARPLSGEAVAVALQQLGLGLYPEALGVQQEAVHVEDRGGNGPGQDEGRGRSRSRGGIVRDRGGRAGRSTGRWRRRTRRSAGRRNQSGGHRLRLVIATVAPPGSPPPPRAPPSGPGGGVLGAGDPGAPPRDRQGGRVGAGSPVPAVGGHGTNTGDGLPAWRPPTCHPGHGQPGPRPRTLVAGAAGVLASVCRVLAVETDRRLRWRHATHPGTSPVPPCLSGARSREGHRRCGGPAPSAPAVTRAPTAPGATVGPTTAVTRRPTHGVPGWRDPGVPDPSNRPPSRSPRPRPTGARSSTPSRRLPGLPRARPSRSRPAEPVSGAFIAPAGVDEVATWYRDALEATGKSTLDLSSPLEDGSRVLDMQGDLPECRLRLTFRPEADRR